MKERRKDTKKQKEERRVHDANLYNEAFLHGYWIGKEEGVKEGLKQALEEKKGVMIHP
jgi:flagellar biosynthesis/type III secretory pathway protein FliH